MLSPRFFPLPFYPYTWKELKKVFDGAEIVDIFGNIKFPFIEYSWRFNLFLNRHFSRSRFAQLFAMDIVCLVKNSSKTKYSITEILNLRNFK